MPESTIADRVGDLFGGILGGLVSNPVVQVMWAVIAGYLVVLWLASAWWTYQDLRRRHEDPALPYLAAAMIVLASPVLFPFALVVYSIVRPAMTLAEAREHELEELLEELDPLERGCPGCRRSIEPSWLNCPACRTRLAYQCAACGRSMELDWSLCAWCGAEFGRERVPAPQAAPAAAGRVAAAESAGEKPPAATPALPALADAAPARATVAGNGSQLSPAAPQRPGSRVAAERRRGKRPTGRENETIRA